VPQIAGSEALVSGAGTLFSRSTPLDRPQLRPVCRRSTDGNRYWREGWRPTLSESCTQSRVVISWLDEVASHAWYESHHIARGCLRYFHVHRASVDDDPQTARLFRPDITSLDVDRNRLTEIPVSRLRETTDDDRPNNLFAYDEPPSR
jgi:hypothetical protein